MSEETTGTEVPPEVHTEQAADQSGQTAAESAAEGQGEAENAAGASRNKGETARKVGRTILGYLDKGVEAGKKGLKSAGDALSDFGDKSVLRIELQQLKGKRNAAVMQLGELAYRTFTADSGAVLSAADGEAATILAQLAAIEADMQRHTEALKKGNA